MKVSLRLLSYFVDLPKKKQSARSLIDGKLDDNIEIQLGSDLQADVNCIAEILTKQGFEVESITSMGPELTSVIVGKIRSCSKHPTADKLQICQVDIGNHKTIQIVCGAKNAKAGMFVAAALPGSVLAGGLKIESSTIRDVPSAGMLCSRAELGLQTLSYDGDGIWDLGLYMEGWLTQSDLEKQLGNAVLSALELDDTVLEIGVTPNRPDMLCHLGVARDLAAGLNYASIPSKVKEFSFSNPLRHESELKSGKTHEKTQQPSTQISQSNFFEKLVSDVNNFSKITDKNSIFSAKSEEPIPAFFVKVTNLKPKASPPWVRAIFDSLGLTSIDSVVDASNLILTCFGQPSHAFDYEKIKDSHAQNKQLTIRKSKENEAFIALDGKTRALNSHDIVVTDEKDVHALLGVIGGELSKVTSETTTAILEFAFPDPVQVRKSSRRIGRKTDSGFQFEKGIDASQRFFAATELYFALNYLNGTEVSYVGACQSVRMDSQKKSSPSSPPSSPQGSEGKSFGSKSIPGVLDRLGVAKRLFETTSIEFSKGTLEKNVGHELIPFESQLKILESLGFSTIEKKVNAHIILIPSWRLHDVQGPHDLVEECVRVVGIDKIPAVPLFGPVKVSEDDVHLPAQERIAWKAVNLGYTQIESFHFMKNTDVEKLTGKQGSDAFGAPVHLLNPIAKDEPYMHTTLLPNLLRKVARNTSFGVSQGQLFHVTRTFQNLDVFGSIVFPDVDANSTLPCAEANRMHSLYEYQPKFANLYSKEKDLGRGRPAETPRLSGVVFGNKENKMWHNVASQPWKIQDVLGHVLELCRTFAPGVTLETRSIPEDHPLKTCFHPSLAIHLLAHGPSGEIPVGCVGSVHPRTRRAFEATTDIFVFEINLSSLLLSLPQVYTLTNQRATPIQLPRVERDFAFLVSKETQAGALRKYLEAELSQFLESTKKVSDRNEHQKNEVMISPMKLESVSIFDIFSGLGVPENQHSVALRIVLEPLEKTLTDADIKIVSEYLISQIKSKYFGELRQ